MEPYLIVAADFVQTGGMDVANYHLAAFLAGQGREVRLVTHSAADDLASLPNVSVHLVPKPLNSYLLGEPLLDRYGSYWASECSARGGRVVVNGGNCIWGDINWVHYVHAAYAPQSAVGALRRVKNRWAHRRFLARERDALHRARAVIANSDRTKRDLIELLGVPSDRIHTVYLGTDSERFRPVTAFERRERRADLFPAAGESPLVTFIGALGDRRKGFDTVFAAWELLCANPDWDANLVVVGAGAELPRWKSRAVEAGLESRIQFLGFRTDVPAILQSSDALVAPTRYDSYGVGVQEALCCGLPAFVSQSAGVAERYPVGLHDLLIPDPDDSSDLARRLQAWRAAPERYRDALISFAQELRSYSWDRMAAQIIAVAESKPSDEHSTR